MIVLMDHARETTFYRERLGAKTGDLVAIKTHQWFAGFDWGGVQAGECSNQVRAVGHVGGEDRQRIDGLTMGTSAWDRPLRVYFPTLASN